LPIWCHEQSKKKRIEIKKNTKNMVFLVNLSG